MDDFHETLVDVAHAYTSLGLERFQADVLRVLREEYSDNEAEPLSPLVSIIKCLLNEGRTILRLHDVLVYHDEDLKISYERLVHFLSELIMVIQAWPYKTFAEKTKKERRLQIVRGDLI